MIRSDKELGLIGQLKQGDLESRSRRAGRLAIMVTCVSATVVAFVAYVTGLPGFAISGITVSAGWATWRWVMEPMFERRLAAIYAESSGESGFVAWPTDRLRQYNGSGEPCDMWIGPCCCGATHTAAERGV